MTHTHTWFATVDDLPLILDWLREAHAEIADLSTSPAGLPTDGRELMVHFPAIGPVVYWPEKICLSDYPENSARWRQAVLLLGKQEPRQRHVDADQSSVAGLRLPELRGGVFWVTGCLWFPGSKLRERFPDLARVCARFERWVRKFPTVFENTKGAEQGPYSKQLCMCGIMERVVAFPAAELLLKNGACMVHHLTSPRSYSDFKCGLELSRHNSSDDLSER